LNRIPEFDFNALQSFSEFRTKFTPNSLQDILNSSLFCNENIKFRDTSLFFKSFLSSGLRTIRDIWDKEILNFKDSIQIYNSLFDKRNCIQGRIQWGAHPARVPPKIGENMIFWRKIVIFHTKYPKYFRTSLRSAQFF
jgi:hypothetical protein